MSTTETTPTSREKKALTLVDPLRPLSESLLWPLTRNYYQRRGVEAWSLREVPHYVTNHPALAHAYADVALGFVRDMAAAAAQEGRVWPTGPSPLTILEIGAGSGMLAAGFMTRFSGLLEQSPYSELPYRYVLSDSSHHMHEYWLNHPTLSLFFEDGLLDVASYDFLNDDSIKMELGGDVLTAGQTTPLIVIANYVLDTLPADAFYRSDEILHDWLVALFVEGEPGDLKALGSVKRIRRPNPATRNQSSRHCCGSAPGASRTQGSSFPPQRSGGSRS
jgi:hypothetical protein